MRSVWAGWSDDLRPLKLSRGGRIAATGVVLLILTIGALAVVTGVAFAFYNLFSGRDTDNAVAVQIVFTFVIVLAAMVLTLGASLGVVAGIDAAARAMQSLRRALAKPS